MSGGVAQVRIVAVAVLESLLVSQERVLDDHVEVGVMAAC